MQVQMHPGTLAQIVEDMMLLP